MATVSKKARSKPTVSKGKPQKPATTATKHPAAKPAAARRGGGTKARAAQRATEPAEPERASAPMAEVDAEVLEFIAAIDTFKKQHSRPFPSWSEVLLIVRQLGYRRP